MVGSPRPSASSAPPASPTSHSAAERLLLRPGHHGCAWQVAACARLPAAALVPPDPCCCPPAGLPPAPAAADNRLLIFGGHGDERDLTGFRAYNHGTGRVVSTKMASGRWCAGRQPACRQCRQPAAGRQRRRWSRHACPLPPAAARAAGMQRLSWQANSLANAVPVLVLPPAPRRYPTPCTLPDGRVLVVGGVKHNGQVSVSPGVGGWRGSGSSARRRALTKTP